MLSSNKKVEKAFLVLAFFSFVMTIITVLSLNNRYHIIESLRKLDTKDQHRSSDNINEAIEYFISNAELLVSNLRTAVGDSFANLTAVSRSITEVKEHIKILLSEVEHQLQEAVIKLVLSLPVINNHNFTYNHNRIDACSNKTIKLLMVVPSAPANFEKRKHVRKGNKGDYIRNNTNDAILLFFLGRPSSNQNYMSLQNEIDEEVKEFGDIIQENFDDIYANNRLKSVSMLRWISTFCSNAKYVIRSDDDVNIKIPSVLAAVERTNLTLSNFIIGRKRIDDLPTRNIKSKYYLSEKEYPNRTFPPYLLGGLLGYPGSTAKLLYEAALRVQPIWLEDVFITGICASKLNIPILTDPAVVFQHGQLKRVNLRSVPQLSQRTTAISVRPSRMSSSERDVVSLRPRV